MQRISIAVLAAVALALPLPRAESGSPGSAATDSLPRTMVPPKSAIPSAVAAAAEQVVVLQTVRGDIVIRLDEVSAPRTAGNFRRLVQQGFYDGTYFHGVFPGFKIHGGDPNTRNDDPSDDGVGGPGYTLPPEFGLTHVRGAVAAARLPDLVNREKESNGSQFFIVLSPQPPLDQVGYTVFGHVIRGLDVADSIARLANQPGLYQGRAGPDPQRRALIGRAYLAPLSRFARTHGAK
jgi:cyclophilin family peptidyl-prolyl cis-trans isomerase